MTAALLLLSVLTHTYWLSWCVSPLMSEHPVRAPTHLLPLGGESWIDFAASWQRARGGRRILLLEDAGGNLVRLGIVPPQHEVAKALLTKKGVPAGAIEVVGRDEDAEWADDLHLWLEGRPAARVLLVAPEFRTRLVVREVRRAFRDDDERRHSPTGIRGLADRRFGRSNWWRSRAGVLAFASAWLDLVHAIGVGPPQPGDYPRWDAVAYERELVRRVGSECEGSP